MKRVLLGCLLAVLLVGLACAGAAEEAEPFFAPSLSMPQAAEDWAAGKEGIDYEALFQIAWKEMAGAKRAQRDGEATEDTVLESAWTLPLEMMTGPFFLYEEEGLVRSGVMSTSTRSYFELPERWEAIRDSDRPVVFVVAAQAGDRVLREYMGGFKVKASTYDILVIDENGTLLGAATVKTEGSAPSVITIGKDKTYFDENPYLAFLDALPVEGNETMIIRGGVLVTYRGEDEAEIQIPEGVERIAEEVFKGHSEITSVQFPASLKRIDAQAFSGCSGLATIQFEAGLESIGPNAFYQCTKLEALALPEGLLRIGDQAFASCGMLDVLLPESLVEIGESAFSNCDWLMEVRFPSSLEVIGYEAFRACDGLTDVIFAPEAVCRIDTHAFAETPWMDGQQADYVVLAGTLLRYNGAWEAFEVPQGVAHISMEQRVERESLVLPEGVISLGRNTLQNGDLSEITFPDTLTYVGVGALVNLPWYKQQQDEFVIIGRGVCVGTSIKAGRMVVPEGVEHVAYLGEKEKVQEIVFPESCRSISRNAYVDSGDEVRGLRRVVIPAGVEDIHPDAFGANKKTLTVVCAPGSAAEAFALEKEFEVQYSSGE